MEPRIRPSVLKLRKDSSPILVGNIWKRENYKQFVLSETQENLEWLYKIVEEFFIFIFIERKPSPILYLDFIKYVLFHIVKFLFQSIVKVKQL